IRRDRPDSCQQSFPDCPAMCCRGLLLAFAPARGRTLRTAGLGLGMQAANALIPPATMRANVAALKCTEHDQTGTAAAGARHESDKSHPHFINIDINFGDNTMLRIVLAAGLVLVSTAVLADNKSDCLDSKDHEQRIKGCSAIIQHNPKDVIAYHNRGDAYGLKGDFDHAIADYTKAIEINPNYAPAYNGRGRAYTSKGDYVHAVADVTRASELTPKVRPWPAVVKAAPPKAKAATQVGMPVAVKAPAAEKAPMPAKAPAAEKPQVPGKSGEKASAAVKATGVEKPSDDSWP